jgi:hypothetical protein
MPASTGSGENLKPEWRGRAAVRLNDERPARKAGRTATYVSAVLHSLEKGAIKGGDPRLNTLHDRGDRCSRRLFAHAEDRFVFDPAPGRTRGHVSKLSRLLRAPDPRDLVLPDVLRCDILRSFLLRRHRAQSPPKHRRWSSQGTESGLTEVDLHPRVARHHGR